MPAFAADILEWAGRKYIIGIGHKEVRVDKTADEDFRLLTMAAVAKEIRFGKASLQCEHIFRELAAIHDQTPPAWLKLKVLELMLSLEDGILESEQEYIPSDRIKLAAHLRDHLIGLRLHDFSLEAMAKEHRLSTAHMQRIFKAVYGQPMLACPTRTRWTARATASRISAAS